MRERVSVEDVSSVSLAMLRRYLIASGWTRRGFREDASPALVNGAEVFAREIDRRSAPPILLPSEAIAVDLPQRVRDAVQVLTEFETRGSQDVIDSIKRVGYDVIRSAIPSEFVTDDTIRLATATDFVSQMRGLLAATATTEKKPRPTFGRLLKESVQYADACRFGHTYRGSFGFVIESPLPALDLMPLLVDAPPTPFERRVLQRFARGISTVVQAVDADSTVPITSAVNAGFSANGCEQFADLIDAVSPAGLKFSFDLSPEWAVDRSMDGAVYLVTAAHGEACRSAARELRRDDTAVPVDVAGRVVRLQNQTDPSDLTSQTGEHEIVVLWSSNDFGDIQVRTNLIPADYLAAVGAHGQGLPIWVSGTLVRVGRQWVLNAPHSFKVPRQNELDFDDEEKAT
jgi:hypothetical protein